MTVKHRPIRDIMYSEESLDIILIQPPLLQRMFREEQDQVHTKFWDTVNNHAALLGDLPFEPNHGLYLLAAVLQREGVSVDVLDFHMFDKVLRPEGRMIENGDIADVLARKHAKIYGISVKTVAASRAMEIARLIKNHDGDSIVVLGGIHATFKARELLESCDAIDIVLRGEADESIVELWHHRNSRTDWSDIAGAVFRDESGTIIEIDREQSRIDLDSLPYPAYGLVCEESLPLVPRILSARGCVLRCGFCVVVAFYNYKINFRSPASVVDEIEYMKKHFGVSFICLGDLTFMSHPRYGKEICTELIRRNVDVKWWCQSTVGRIDYETAVLMQKAGCVQIGFGIESGEQNGLDASTKRVTLDRARAQCEIAKRAGLSVQTYWVLGLPNETFASATKTVDLMSDFISQELTDIVHLSVSTPFPGTPFYNNPEGHGYRIIDHDFDNYWMNCDELGAGRPVVETETLTRDHIYMFWQLALATATEEFRKRYSSQTGRVHFYPQDFGEPNI